MDEEYDRLVADYDEYLDRSIDLDEDEEQTADPNT
jgi:hypothetical protein